MSATGTDASELALEHGRLPQLRLEEAHAVDGGQHRFDDAAEACRHSAREDDLCDLAAAKRFEPGSSNLVVARIVGRRERRDLVDARCLDDATHEIRLGRQLADSHASPQRLEESLVEAEPLENRGSFPIDVDHDA